MELDSKAQQRLDGLTHRIAGRSSASRPGRPRRSERQTRARPPTKPGPAVGSSSCRAAIVHGAARLGVAEESDVPIGTQLRAGRPAFDATGVTDDPAAGAPGVVKTDGSHWVHRDDLCLPATPAPAGPVTLRGTWPRSTGPLPRATRVTGRRQGVAEPTLIRPTGSREATAAAGGDGTPHS
jgi:hypothetical protein